MSSLQSIDLHRYPLYLAYRRSSVSPDHFKGVFHAHQGLELLFIHQGSGHIILGQKSYEITAGMLCVFQPFQLHHVKVNMSTDIPFIRSIVHFEPAVYEPFFEKWPALKQFFTHLHAHQLTSPCIYGLDESSDLFSLISDMQERLTHLIKANDVEEFSLFLIVLFRSLKTQWKMHGNSSLPAITRRSHQAEAMLRWLEQHYKEPLRLEHMADELHFSPYHLSHIFKATIGGSISEYVAARRVQEAIKRLTSSDDTIAQISEELGITSPSYFCKMFKEHMGDTPHQFRKKWKQMN
ncbi:AraC family transcriptional regulator [Paenibacillus sp. Marseille-Q4541]|uniref:AraC family transcriptional regulator n=1 Tax=Paenibacillus sp. Marseille-Q4541 TaxID=2831522 RepID=UPI001BAC44FE|nr:AraC family transcriptional regulator [Paenibacillus sp. Marseille-Q4541]